MKSKKKIIEKIVEADDELFAHHCKLRHIRIQTDLLLDIRELLKK